MIPPRAPTAAALILAASACSAAPATFSEWTNGSIGGIRCDALAVEPGLTLSVSLSPEPGLSGVAVIAPPLTGYELEQPAPSARLLIDGEPIEAPAIGTLAQGSPGLFFRFDPRTLIRRQRDGFGLAVEQDGRTLFEAEARETAAAFDELIRCYRSLR
jgi:hypothetical protein